MMRPAPVTALVMRLVCPYTEVAIVDVAIVLGLLLQGSALILLFRRLRRDWVRHIGAVFILLAVLYHGANEIILGLFPGYDPYRPLVDPTTYVGMFVLWVSVAILMFTVAYLAALGHKPAPIPQADIDRQWARSARFFDWRIMLVAAVPLMVVSLGGQTSTALINAPQQGVAATVGLANQYFLLALVLASFGIVTRFGRRWIIPVVMVQSLLVAAIAQRAVILFAAALLLYAMSRVGIRLKRRQLAFFAGIAVILTLAITSARASEGRLATTSGDSLRFGFLVAGLGQIGSPIAWHQVAADLGYRFDGNSFGALELEALDRGFPPLGTIPLQNDLLLAVPSFLNPNKDSSDLGTRVEKVYAEEHLGLSEFQIAPGEWLDILPTQLGTITGYWGPWGILGAAILLGLVFGRADRWLLRTVSPVRLLLALGLLYCALDYEGSFETYTVTFRGILLLLAVVYVCKAVGASFGRAVKRTGPRSLGHPLPAPPHR
jgi:hypothetical protein